MTGKVVISLQNWNSVSKEVHDNFSMGSIFILVLREGNKLHQASEYQSGSCGVQIPWYFWHLRDMLQRYRPHALQLISVPVWRSWGICFTTLVAWKYFSEYPTWGAICWSSGQKDHLLQIKLICSWHLPNGQREQMMDHLPISNALLCTVNCYHVSFQSFLFQVICSLVQFAAPKDFPVNVLTLEHLNCTLNTDFDSLYFSKLLFDLWECVHKSLHTWGPQTVKQIFLDCNSLTPLSR